MISLVRQNSSHLCFAACLESVLTDFCYPVSQTDLVDRYPDSFSVGLVGGNGNSIEGSLRFDKISDIEIGESISFSPTTQFNYGEGVIIFVRWEGDKTKKHAVRFHRVESGRIYFMEPSEGVIDSRPFSEFSSWVIAALKVTTNAS